MLRMSSDIKNRDGYTIEVAPIEEVEYHENGGCSITRGEPGWGTFGVGAEELNGFKPQVGDAVIVYTLGFSSIRGIVIDGRVIRYTTPEQADAEHEQWKKNLRLERLERYVSKGDSLKARTAALPEPLRERMYRFANEHGVNFWIEDAEYEMAALEGASALLRKVKELGLIQSVDQPTLTAGGTDDAVKWINDWWDINSDKHDPPYDYKKQMELVPDFGEGHSGNTAGAAYALSIRVLEGSEV